VAVVNQSFSTRYFMGADPLTFRLGFGKKDRFASVTVIGVMDDMKESDLARETEPEIYLCATQLTPDISFYAVATAATQLAVRTGSNPDSIAAPVRQILHDIAPDARVGDIKALHRVVEDSIGNQRLAAKLLELFAAAALLISLSGLYALLQFSVNQGIRDIGVRLAVGAGRADVIRFVVVRASMVVGTGLAIGVFLSFVLQATIRPYLFGLQAHGLFTILAVTFVFAVCGAVAAYLPARHAAAIEPMQALREQ
jgi:ABC-type antimicrobial peptide transport system permease subunit